MRSAAETVDDYFFKRYHPTDYNCLHFTCEVWRDLTGRDIASELASALTGPKERRRGTARQLRAFERLDRPADPCIVFMERARMTPHVGVYLRGRVLHIGDLGVQFQPLSVAAQLFDRVRFYR